MYIKTYELADKLNVTHQTIMNWLHSGHLKPAFVNERGLCMFSKEQVEAMEKALPLPKHGKSRIEWLAQFNPDETIIADRLEITERKDKGLLPRHNELTYPVEPAQRNKISEIVEKSNKLMMATLGRKTNIHDLNDLAQSTKDYFDFCALEGCMPSYRRLANWFGYSLAQMDRVVDSNSVQGQYLNLIKDAIKDNLEQAALTNSVNNISAMFILKSQYDYVETQKQIIEHVNPLGEQKSVDEILTVIDADIVE